MLNNRIKRHKRIRRHISGTDSRPRLCVFRSSKHTEIQLIDDESMKTIAGMKTPSLVSKSTKLELAKQLGLEFGKKVLELEKGKYTSIIFDRGGYQYHGRVKAVAEGLRESGLKF